MLQLIAFHLQSGRSRGWLHWLCNMNKWRRSTNPMHMRRPCVVKASAGSDAKKEYLPLFIWTQQILDMQTRVFLVHHPRRWDQLVHCQNQCTNRFVIHNLVSPQSIKWMHVLETTHNLSWVLHLSKCWVFPWLRQIHSLNIYYVTLQMIWRAWINWTVLRTVILDGQLFRTWILGSIAGRIFWSNLDSQTIMQWWACVWGWCNVSNLIHGWDLYLA